MSLATQRYIKMFIRPRVIFNTLLASVLLSSITIFVFNKNEVTKTLAQHHVRKTRIQISSNSSTVSFDQESEISVLQGKQATFAFHESLLNHEHKYMSQNGEDGVILYLIDVFKLNNKTKRYVEIGADIGIECNTKYIRDFLKWDGVQFDARNSFPDRGLHQEIVTHQNVLRVLAKYNQWEFDLLSEDTDYADFWILEKILTRHKPKLIIHEVNAQPPNMCVTVKKPLKVFFWQRGDYHGGSVCAFYCLAKCNAYTMVYCESEGVNCFWVRNDLLESYLKVSAEFVQSILTPAYLYNTPKSTYEPTSNVWHEVKC